jgi:protein TonB
VGHAAVAGPHPDSTPSLSALVSLGWTPESHTGRRSATLSASIVLHAVLVAAVIVVPLLFEQRGPEPSTSVRAFFVEPATVAAPPPPPPPPAPGPRSTVSRPPAPPRETTFVAPIEVPAALPEPEQDFDAFGVEGGVPGGVEGGLPGGVVGGVVGGIPSSLPPPPAPPRVRVGGAIVAPKLVRKVLPEYPELARQARVSALVIIEAVVGTDGHVKSAHILRGHGLVDQAALDAVGQWRYQPLLLNGVPTEFVLTVTVTFSLTNPDMQ